MNASFRNEQVGRILIVDDDPFMRGLLERALATDGYLIGTAADGREALVLFEEDKFDLVIVDYEMPDMKGDELALIINALAPNQRLMMITAYPQAVAINLLAEVDTVVRKPFDLASLRTQITQLIQKPPHNRDLSTVGSI
jgi:DNA-binding response OmpR family regulator